eukprot:FR742587.1.p3 GENE.FR742587.1~~FR742587.1.p3  ORF type:complete len:104 (+),score=54.91 FR742587.1:852-1163(+)
MNMVSNTAPQRARDPPKQAGGVGVFFSFLPPPPPTIPKKTYLSAYQGGGTSPRREIKKIARGFPPPQVGSPPWAALPSLPPPRPRLKQKKKTRSSPSPLLPLW